MTDFQIFLNALAWWLDFIALARVVVDWWIE